MSGRLHRLHDGKKIVEVYDYVDSSIPMLARMFEKRLRVRLGYSIPEVQTTQSLGARKRRLMIAPIGEPE